MRNQKQRLSLAIGRALLVSGFMALTVPAFAADAAQQNTDPTRQDSSGNNDDASTELAAIVVTAQSREQRLEDVPIAVQVVGADNIQTHAATDISQMDAFVPGLVVYAEQPTQPSYELRGIGGSGFGIGTDSAVGVYVDGVYSARSGSSMLAFNDVKRIEVLKGPQGTLFGRNAAAGAISIITNRPSPDFEAIGRIRVGNHGQHYGYALLNLPAGKDMAFRFSVMDSQSDGWVRDDATGKHHGSKGDWGSRASWLWHIGDSTDLWLTWNHERLDQPGRPAFGLIPMSSDPYQRAPFPPNPNNYLDPLDAPLYNDTLDGGETRQFDNLTLHIDHYMDWGTFSSISAWTQFDTFNRNDNDGTNHIVTHLDTTNIESNENYYQEFKFSGQTRLANWVAGASWYSEKGDQTSQVGLFTDSIDTMVLNLGIPTGTPDGTLYNYFNSVLQAFQLPYSVLGKHWREQIANHQEYTSTAIYGDIIWHLTDKTDLTTGARYTRDTKDFSWFNSPRIAADLDQVIDALVAAGVLAQAGVDPAVFRQNLVFTDAVGLPVETSNTWTDFSPRVVLSSHFTDNLMGYVSAAKGYKAGGYNSVQVNSQFEPEEVWNYEAGIKSVMPQHNLIINASVYHYRYSNLQSLRLDPNTAGSGVPRYLVESSDQEADGLDLQVQWMPIDNLQLSFNAAYIDSRYGTKFSATGADLSGEPTGIPKFTYALGMQYAWHIHGGELVFNLNHAYRGDNRCNADSSFQGSCQVSPNFSVGEATNRTDLRLGWNSASNRWGAALFVNNLFDNRYVLGVNNISATTLGTPFASISPPRTVGLELQVRY